VGRWNFVAHAVIRKLAPIRDHALSGGLSMDFKVARPDVVRAINQRWLLKFWKRHLGSRSVPLWQAVESEDMSHMSSNLSFLDVTGSDGRARFIIRFNGFMIAQVYGLSDCRGKYLDDVIPPARHTKGLAPYHRAVADNCPVYTIYDLTDRNGRLVHYERLLLPFSRGGETVDSILASFEFICEDGAFDGHELMKMQAVPPMLRLSATMAPQGLT
jgi:hypothetical protein